MVGKHEFYQLRVRNSNLCLNVWGGTTRVNLYTCGVGLDNEIFDDYLFTPLYGGRYLWWDGAGMLMFFYIYKICTYIK